MHPIHSMNIAEWHRQFKQHTVHLADHTRNPSFAKESLAAIAQTKPELPPSSSNLFDLHAHLFVLGQLLNRKPNHAPQPGAFIGFHTHNAIAEVEQAIALIFEHQHDPVTDKDDWQRVTETLSYLRALMLTESGTKLYYFEPYFQAWHSWIYPNRNDTSLYIDELEQLQNAAAELGPALSRYPWLLAQSRICFCLQRDEEALAHLQEIGGSSYFRPDDLFPMLTSMLEARQWERLGNWLIAATPFMERQQLRSLEIFYRYWDEVIDHIPQLEQQMWEPLIRMLPRSSSIYEEKLLRHAKWRQWMDYQLSTGSEPLDYRVSILAPLEKHAPELLLPFYHQAAERHVLLKHRGGYKLAVKLLKRLAKLYKKRKDEERWESYITAFAARHSRLRALQEELRRGKLIP